MRLALNAVLIAAIALLAAGTQVVPHVHVVGWTHEGLDHPPSAVHATLLEHVRYLLEQQQQQQARPSPSGATFGSAPLVLSVGAIALAIFAFGTARPWRPDRLGVARIGASIPGAQFALEPHAAPPRSSFWS